jgi:hypothetical protein
VRDSFDAALTSDFVDFSHCVKGELLLGLSCEFGDALRAGVTTLALVVDDEVVVVALDLGEFPVTPCPKTIVEITEVAWFVSRARASVLVYFDHTTDIPPYRYNAAPGIVVHYRAPVAVWCGKQAHGRQTGYRTLYTDRGVVVYGRNNTSGMIAGAETDQASVETLSVEDRV